MSTDILVVDDETAIADLVEVYLKNEGYTVHKFYNGTDALDCVRRQHLDLAILDVMMPDVDGFTLCQRIREAGHLFPILMLTAKVEDMDKIMGLTLGADDYLTKPIKMKLLVSRVQAILKRIDAETAPAEPAAAGIAVDREHYTVTRDGHEIALPRKEFALLDLLYSSPGKLFSREEIYTKIWGTEVVVGDRTIDVHIRKLRQKIGDERIVTIKGVGYKFEP